VPAPGTATEAGQTAGVFVFDESGGARKRGFTGLAVLLVVALGAVALFSFDPRPRPRAPAAAGDPTGSYGCFFLSAPYEPEATRTREREMEICRREAADAEKRRPIARRTDQAPDPRAARISTALEPAVCEHHDGSGCDRDNARPAVRTDVELVAVVLTAQGFPGAEVRLAHAGDPAPDGSVVYGIRFPDDTCLLGYAEMGAGAGSPRLAGPLPNGGCLP
jgi:hypothetical protein